MGGARGPDPWKGAARRERARKSARVRRLRSRLPPCAAGPSAHADGGCLEAAARARARACVRRRRRCPAQPRMAVGSTSSPAHHRCADSPPRKRIRGAAFGGAHCLGACFEQGAFAPQPRGRRRRSLPHSSGPRGTPNLCAAARQCRRCQVAGPRPQARDPAASTRRRGQRCVAGSPPLVSGASGAATGDGSVRRAPQEGTGGPPACHLLKHFHSHTPLRPQSPVNRPVQA